MQRRWSHQPGTTSAKVPRSSGSARYHGSVPSSWRLSSLVLLLLTAPAGAQEAKAEERALWKQLAQRCGEELAWAEDWEDAAARAREERKPVLAVAWLYPGFDIDDASRTVFAMDEDIIELVRARFVPLRLTKDTRAPFVSQASYGLSATAFGTALLLVSPDGEVFADCPFLQPSAAYDFLSAELAAHAEFPGDERPRDLEGEERAAWHLARGELDTAAKLLEHPHGAREFFLLGRLLRRRHDYEGALEALRDARSHRPGDLAPGIDREALVLELGRGNADAARTLCDGLVASAPTRSEAQAAAFALGVLDLAAGDRASAERRWRALVKEHPESRWAVDAAAGLLIPVAQLAGFELDHDSPELLASLREVPYAKSPVPAPKSAAKEALRWLRELRRPDGTWIDPSELETGASGVNAISGAIDTLCVRALLAHAPGSDVDEQREARLALAAGRASLAGRSDAPAYMTYEVWSDAVALELLADLIGTGKKVPAGELRELGSDLVKALAVRQRPNGGWSYFESASLEKGALRPEQSISFVTASVVLALLRARDARIEFDEDVLARGLDALEAMRSERGVFAYMLWSNQERAPEDPVAGAAGRGPLCELALLCAGRSDAARLRAALELFFEHSDTLAKETGKALMHCGAEGQGCHYVLYDYASAARAIAALPAAERKPYATRLLALLATTARTDGAYLDTPILGPQSGTALALLALAELDEQKP
jgi:GNAT superfamily N-acetyltransferase